ncbi:MAG TPA: 50S ribosomal protein L25 [Chthoniobacterales bacterium]|jgi:large subunit ribosomal protein L25|nr:50S ribosomal protein L25 [Chthoniobacterales bacterium]
MAQQAKLTAQRRTQVGRNAIKKIKADGMVPGVIYGSTQEPVNLQINGRELLNVLSRASGENILVELEILDGSEKQNALAMIQEIQHNPLQREIVHVDFHAVSANETVSAEVPIETVGEAVGVKVHGGLLEHILRYLEVECLPGDLPQVIEVDVTNLDVGQSLHVRELKLPSGVEAVTDAEQTVVAVVEARVEEEVVEPLVTPTAPEVITAKKPEEGAAPASES